MISLSALERRVADWWRRTVWEFPKRGTPWFHGRFLMVLRAWENAVRSYEPDHMAMRAHALTFRTLLGIIPFLAVSFSLFQAFGGLEASAQLLNQKIIENLAPGSGPVVREYMTKFVERVSTGAIGGVGVVVLFLTVVALLTYIEKSFNGLWNIEKTRPFFQRFVIYWTMVTVGPVLIALSFSLTTPARLGAIVEMVGGARPDPSVLGLALAQVNWLFTWAGMTLLFVIMPNTRVRWASALGGGFVAAILWELGKALFAWASATLFNYGAVYGSLGALPVFLLWLQIGWLIILLGCKLTYGFQYSRALQEERAALTAGPIARELVALRAMIAVARAYESGAPPLTAEDLTAHSPAPFEATQEVLNRLVAMRLLLAVPDDGSFGDRNQGKDGSPAERYVLSRSASQISMGDVVRPFREGVIPPSAEVVDPAARLSHDLLERAEAAAEAVTQGITLEEAVSTVDAPASS